MRYTKNLSFYILMFKMVDKRCDNRKLQQTNKHNLTQQMSFDSSIRIVKKALLFFKAAGENLINKFNSCLINPSNCSLFPNE